jgi:hypothetical protein
MKIKQHYDLWFCASIISCCLLVALLLVLIEHAPWTGDYWEHKAVVRELSLHVQHPSNPILKVDAPHAFFSPHMVLLGAIVSATGIKVSAAMDIAMIVNLLLFFGAVYILTTLLITEYKNRSKTFLLLLLLILFFWGPQTPLYSSYLHLRSLILTLSYPSVFAFSCSVFAASVAKILLTNRSNLSKQVPLFVILIMILALILLCHPLTFVFAASLQLHVYNNALMQYKFSSQQTLKNTLLLFAAGVLSVMLASLWPYYPVLSLFKYVPGGNQFHADSVILYQSLWKQLFPLLILPVLVFFNSSISLKKEWPWLISTSIFLILFVIGYYTGSYGMGRMMAFLFIFCHLFIVKNLISIKRFKGLWFILLFLLSIPYLLQTRTSFKYILAAEVEIASTADQFQKTSHPAKARLLSFLGPFLDKKTSVVLTDIPTSLFIPAMGARVVAPVYPVYWVADADERKKQVKLFFSATATHAERANLIARYQPDYIVLTPATVWLLPQLTSFIQPHAVASNNGINMYRVK